MVASEIDPPRSKNQRRPLSNSNWAAARNKLLFNSAGSGHLLSGYRLGTACCKGNQVYAKASVLHVLLSNRRNQSASFKCPVLQPFPFSHPLECSSTVDSG